MNFERGKDPKAVLDVGVAKRAIHVKAIDVVYYPPREWSQDLFNFRLSKNPDKILHERSNSVLYRFREDMEETDVLVPLLAEGYTAMFEEGIRNFCSEFYSREFTWELGRLPKPEATEENSRIESISLVYVIGAEEGLRTIHLPIVKIVQNQNLMGLDHFPFHATGYYHKGVYYPFPQKPMPDEI